MHSLRKTISAFVVLIAFITAVNAQRTARTANQRVPASVLIKILRAEDQRRWDDGLKTLLSDKSAGIRGRAALAAGRIGNEAAIPALAQLAKEDQNIKVREMAAFALGEIESYAASDTLYNLLSPGEPRILGARALEALGKIAAALPEADKEHKQEIGKTILGILKYQLDPRVNPDRMETLLGLTAALRARPEAAGPVVAQFLKFPDPRIVADALNTMARLRLKDNSEEVRKLLAHSDPIVRANAARVIGAAEDTGAFDAVLDRALHDQDLRVRVSAIRALANLKDAKAAQPLLDRESQLFDAARKLKGVARPSELNEMLEISTTLGRLLSNTKSEPARNWVTQISFPVPLNGPDSEAAVLESAELEIASARIDPEHYVTEEVKSRIWSRPRSVAQALTEVATIKERSAKLAGGIELVSAVLHDMLSCRSVKFPVPQVLKSNKGQLPLCERLRPTEASDVMRAYAAFKPSDLDEILREKLRAEDVIVRSTAADLIGEQPPNETNSRALIEALPRALRDRDLNDAALSILDALAKQKTAAANDAIKTALDSSDHLIRRRAVNLLKANNAGDFSNRIGLVNTQYTDVDYRRAIARIGKTVRATVLTSKGPFVIEFLAEDAPMTVDNFVMLARKGYFNGQTVPRVVPNFVIQTGDPRGDQNGGPGYSIRCEINEVPYERAAVGMALSGKDTGGSQWFVTHAPQPHLDGGYTVFGRVTSGMDVVDKIARGDTIRRITIIER